MFGLFWGEAFGVSYRLAIIFLIVSHCEVTSLFLPGAAMGLFVVCEYVFVVTPAYIDVV